MTLRKALDIALAPHELEYAVEGGVIRVFPRRTATRFFDIDYVTTRRSATRTLRAPTVPLAATASSAEVTRTDQEYFFEQVADGVGALLSPRGRMHLDRKAALVQVTDYPDRLAQVEQYLDRVLRRVLRQVHLQARLIEVELDGTSAGIDWPAAVVAAGGQHRSQARSSVAPVGTLADFDRLIEALATQGRVTVLSSPSVVTLNNELCGRSVGPGCPCARARDVLGVASSATPVEIKRAFRHQIAQYHPDKVQHLGRDLQDMAAVRAAEFTEAYRRLSDTETRATYDLSTTATAAPPAGDAWGTAAPPAGDAWGTAAPPAGDASGGRPPPTVATSAERAAPPTSPPAAFRHERQVRDDFVRKASLDRLRAVAAAVLGEVEEVPGRGFDVAYVSRARGVLKREAPLMICGRFVPRVDAEAIRDAWSRAIRLGQVSRELCVFLLGNDLASTRELSGIIAELRDRLSRLSATRIIVLPVDVHDWQGPVPAEAPAAARRVLERLRATE